MQVKEAILKRRSVRKYAKACPSEKAVNAVLSAACWAPSGMNNQPWRFKIARGAEKAGLEQFTKYGYIIRNAPLCVCVFLDKDAVYNREKDILAVGACIENMLLRAYSLGLGTCWLGEILNCKDAVREFLKLPENLDLMAVITLGKPLTKSSRGIRRKLEKFLL